MESAHPFYHFSINPANRNSSYFWQLQFLKPAHSVLEIGCASGYFSQYLTDSGVEVTGTEVNPIAAEQARTICKRVITGDIESSEVQYQVSEQFDAVLLGDVLEHLRFPEKMLVQIRSHWLKPGGWVVISVPNSGHWLFRREVLFGRFPYRQVGLFDKTHLHFYTYASLYALVESCGYQVTLAAHSVNPNAHDDLTFACLSLLYRHPKGHDLLHRLESRLAQCFPCLFAYQFILQLRPKG